MENVSINTDYENEKSNFLLDDNNSTSIILLVEKACEQYQQSFGKNNVPLSFIKFYMFEFKKYKSIFKSALRDFYENYKRLKISAKDMAEVYNSSYYAQSSIIIKGKTEDYLQFDSKINPFFFNEMRGVSNTAIADHINNISAICKKIENQKELVNIKDRYENFLIEEYIFDNDFSDYEEKKNNYIFGDDQETEETDSQLIGDAIEDNYQSSGKITKIIIPKIPLPSAYPIKLEESRIDKQKRANKFLAPARQIIFINKNKIVGVKYSTKFIEKRKTKPKTQSKFNWDF